MRDSIKVMNSVLEMQNLLETSAFAIMDVLRIDRVSSILLMHSSTHVITRGLYYEAGFGVSEV